MTYNSQIKKVIDDFNLYLYKSGDKYFGACPLHGGDNPSAFNINTKTGIFWCNTNKCHEISGIGFRSFVRLLLSPNIDEPCDWELVDEYLENNNFEIPDDIDYTPPPKQSVEYALPLSYLDAYDLGNCAFLLNRGFTFDTLKKFSVFTCPDPTKKLYNLCVVPIFDINKTKIIGITARMPWEKCIVCEGYHNPQELCPTLQDVTFNPKWRHFPAGFQKSEHLFNLWDSWRHIKHTGDIIITESPGNVMRLDQCGFPNVVGLLGSTFKDSIKQHELINRLNPRRIFIIGDPDEAGYKLIEDVRSIYPYAISIETDTCEDIGSMDDNRVKELMWRYIL